MGFGAFHPRQTQNREVSGYSVAVQAKFVAKKAAPGRRIPKRFAQNSDLWHLTSDFVSIRVH